MMHRIVLFPVSLTLIGGMSVPPAESDPHVFVYHQLTVVFDEKGFGGFEIRWTFDEMFSSMINKS